MSVFRRAAYCARAAGEVGGARAGHRAPGAPPSGAAPAIMRRRALVALLHAGALAFAFAARVAEGGTWTWADAVAAEREAGAVVDEQVAQERVATRVGVSAGVEGIKDAASAAVTAGGGAANEVRLKASKREGGDLVTTSEVHGTSSRVVYPFGRVHVALRLMGNVIVPMSKPLKCVPACQGASQLRRAKLKPSGARRPHSESAAVRRLSPARAGMAPERRGATYRRRSRRAPDAPAMLAASLVRYASFGAEKQQAGEQQHKQAEAVARVEAAPFDAAPIEAVAGVAEAEGVATEELGVPEVTVVPKVQSVELPAPVEAPVEAVAGDEARPGVGSDAEERAVGGGAAAAAAVKLPHAALGDEHVGGGVARALAPTGDAPAGTRASAFGVPPAAAGARVSHQPREEEAAGRKERHRARKEELLERVRMRASMREETELR